MGRIGRVVRIVSFLGPAFFLLVVFAAGSYGAAESEEGPVLSDSRMTTGGEEPENPQDDAPIQLAIVFMPHATTPTPEVVVEGAISDPLEKVNRIFFKFNDRLYFWVLKPVASGYRSVIPEDARIGVRNFFSNVTTPIRLVNCLLQADLKCAGNETLRFVINTTVGLAGFLDPGKKDFHLEKDDRDFGQTLGVYGIGFGFYIDWPIFGPSSVRDSFGYAGDILLDPRTYLGTTYWVGAGIRAYEIVNEVSLTIGDYEDLKNSALDAYTALKDAYYQYRVNKIRRR
jgi:phospholipid-binding lipoprotein MlaA